MTFGTLTMLCNQHLSSQNIPITPSRSPDTRESVTPRSSHPRHPSPWQPLIHFLFLWVYSLWTFLRDGSTRDVALWVWLLSLGVTFSRFIHVVA